jgi:hypothetical protein
MLGPDSDGADSRPLLQGSRERVADRRVRGLSIVQRAQHYLNRSKKTGRRKPSRFFDSSRSDQCAINSAADVRRPDHPDHRGRGDFRPGHPRPERPDYRDDYRRRAALPTEFFPTW